MNLGSHPLGTATGLQAGEGLSTPTLPGPMTGWGETGCFTAFKEWTHNTEGKGVQRGSRECAHKRHKQVHTQVSTPTEGNGVHKADRKHSRGQVHMLRWVRCIPEKKKR